jgi:hypothetical protein
MASSSLADSLLKDSLFKVTLKKVSSAISDFTFLPPLHVIANASARFLRNRIPLPPSPFSCHTRPFSGLLAAP